MTRALSSVCTNTGGGEKRSWKAFVDYTFDNDYSDKFAKLTIENAGAGGCTPDTGSGEELHNRTITLTYTNPEDTSSNITLTKQFNGKSWYYNCYPSKTFSTKNHLTWVGSGGANNGDWGTIEVLYPKTNSSYDVSLSFNMNVTNGYWTGSRTASSGALSVVPTVTHTIPSGVQYWSTTLEQYITAGNDFAGYPEVGDRYEILESGDVIFIYTYTADGWKAEATEDFAETSFVVLDKIFEFPVTDMSHAFDGCSTLQSANISTNATDISYAFNDTSVSGYFTIPDSVTDYEDAFDGTSGDIFLEGNVPSDLISGNVHLPKWTATHTVVGESPDYFGNGKAKITVYYSLDNITYTEILNPDGWIVTENGGTPNSWSVTVTLDKTQVVDNTDATTTVYLKVGYANVTSEETNIQKAFYSTARNSNYNNGLANNVFIAGIVSNDPNLTVYSSRVWYSYVNNPLYFPDLNYVEVGSNDKSVMGLVKVGSYLGVIKQGSTIDSSVYLAYPTSFEDDTTFAVKQSINGVGAVSKYAFNVLNDETLFLSEDGIMAIEPTEDEQHKIKDRSYFINGKLLKEENLETAYSFVWNGFYILGINGHVYVLDGNQRNSWGNDKTNLVYECYYLENVNAKNFVKVGDELWFTDGNAMMRFKDDNSNEPYTDDGVPVFARWSTVLDDDGSVHYYKTMLKKGNVVSVLPTEYKYAYMEVSIDEETFDEDKTLYFYKLFDNFVQCKETDIFNPLTQYYIRELDKPATKVYIRKDNNDLVEIERTFNEATLIPSELIVKKKFKKYKRLQFILENGKPEPFGVDMIIKSYTIGNYAKK